MTSRPYPVLVVPLSEEDGGGYAAYAPDLYGCMSDGETPEEAVSNLQSAILEWCDEMVRMGRVVPEPGSAAREASKAHDEVMDLLRRQDELLQVQAKRNTDLRKQLDAISTRLADVMARSSSDGSHPFDWLKGLADDQHSNPNAANRGVH